MNNLQQRITSALILCAILIISILYAKILAFFLWTIALFISIYEAIKLAIKIPPSFVTISALNFYIILSFVALLFLYMTQGKLILLLFFAVWLSDTGAYIIGKTFGGKKMCPKISPNKTWSGFLGAVLAPCLLWPCFLFTPIAPDISNLSALLGLIIIGVLSVAGDLAVSLVKRKAQVKDTGNLIPGHGGLLDRIDSLLLVSFGLALLVL